MTTMSMAGDAWAGVDPTDADAARVGPVALPDLPVQVDVREGLRSEVVAWVEGDLRWQVVTGDSALAPQAIITDDPHRAAGGVLVLAPDLPTDQRTRAATEAMRAGALDVVNWPDERDRLAAAVTRRTRSHDDRPAPVRAVSATRLLRIAGASGGVGTSTVALALAGWAAWSGARTVVAGDDDLIALCGLGAWEGPGTGEIAALDPRDTGREVATLARAVDGVQNLHVIGGGGRHVAVTDEWPVDMVIVDDRCQLDAADLIVGVANRRLSWCAQYRSRMLIRSGAGVGRREICRLLGGSPLGWVEQDARVLRAGLAGRVPSALPGRWVRDLSSRVARRGRGEAA